MRAHVAGIAIADVEAMFHRRPARLAAFDYRGFHRYHVRVRTFRHARHFSSGSVVTTVRDHLLQLAATHQMDVTAYCFMPDHVHVLAVGRSRTAELRPFVSGWKQRTGFWFRRLTNERLWQSGYFERVLRENEGDERVVRYILENPVRAGLASGVGEYPHAWSAYGRHLCARGFSPADTAKPPIETDQRG